MLPPSLLSCGDRCLFLAYMGCVVFAIALLSALVGGYDSRLAVSAGAASTAAILLHLYLHTTGLLTAFAEEDDSPIAGRLRLSGRPRRK